jgi:hypothetical protein
MASGNDGKDDSDPDSVDSGPPGSERRAGTRHLACFAAEIQMERWNGARTAVILKVDDQVSLNLYILGDETMHTVTGRVVRYERRDPATAGLWPYSVGVQFDAPLDDLEDQIKEVALRQAALLGRKDTT